LKISLKLPMFGMNMEEATISKWHKARGDTFTKGDPLYEIESEKVTQEIAAPCNGTMLEIFTAAGEDAQVGQVVCTIDGAY
jgi:pyruvate/2-oxoglutarate dehydrogenase complex dihydrolipoamide acyltransferase (E2) component